MKKFEELPQRVQAVITRCREGKILCRSYRMKETGDIETLAHFEPDGKRCGPASAREAINSGFLTPQSDGLFGSDTAQTFVAAAPSDQRSAAA